MKNKYQNQINKLGNYKIIYNRFKTIKIHTRMISCNKINK